MDVGLSFLLLPLGRLRFGGDGNVLVCVLSARQVAGGEEGGRALAFQTEIGSGSPYSLASSMFIPDPVYDC